MKLFDGGLDATHLVARTTALAAVIAKHGIDRDAKLAKLTAELDRARERHDALVADARAVVVERGDQLDRLLAKDIRTRLYPLAIRFATEPRVATIAMAELWRNWQSRCVTELGETLATTHLLGAFAAAVGGEAFVGIAAGVSVFAVLPLAGAFGDRLGAPAIEATLRALEVAAAQLGALALDPDPERTERLLESASERRQTIAVDALDNQRRIALAAERDLQAEAGRAIWRANDRRNHDALIARRSSEDRGERMMRGGGR